MAEAREKVTATAMNMTSLADHLTHFLAKVAAAVITTRITMARMAEGSHEGAAEQGRGDGGGAVAVGSSLLLFFDLRERAFEAFECQVPYSSRLVEGT